MFEIFKRKPYDEGFLPEKDGHKIRYYKSGNPKGTSILFFHGGPGSRFKACFTAPFDLKKHHIISFDQRGCGKSEYKDLLYNNTTQYSLEDAIRLLEYLHIDGKIIVSGTSWGTALALLFAQSYAARTGMIILFSSFIASAKEDRKWFEGNMKALYPDMCDFIKERGFYEIYPDIIRYNNRKLMCLTAIAGINAGEDFCKKYRNYLFSLSEGKDEKGDDEEIPRKIFCHYDNNGYFIEEGRLIGDAYKIEDIPALIIHNRGDLNCPLEYSWDIHKMLPRSVLKILPKIGHGIESHGKEAASVVKEFLK